MDFKKTKLLDIEPGEEIVISGIAGRFPESDNIKHLQENLFNRVDLGSNDNRRWNHEIFCSKMDYTEKSIVFKTGEFSGQTSLPQKSGTGHSQPFSGVRDGLGIETFWWRRIYAPARLDIVSFGVNNDCANTRRAKSCFLIFGARMFGRQTRRI
ncbi:fatty acid synthase [Lasius niger]|uniref:Fatty acid synthase n=1 Tax=Lasius niger TaxID=67767 RepID=A0A0J7KL74_LASNI|nr:fatty acid synthase [Lasius niger]